MDTIEDPMNEWLASGKTAVLSGLELRPEPHPFLPGVPLHVVKGQATVYPLRQPGHGYKWLLKKFTPSRCPSREYLEAVPSCLPGRANFVACSQRRVLSPLHIDKRNSSYWSESLAKWLNGTVLMLCVPGLSWAAVSESLREGDLAMTLDERLKLAGRFADCIAGLEGSGCAHRDLSASNVFMTQDGRVYLIDWDCLYHWNLPYQPNTTVGTRGYIAPFMRNGSEQWDASISWCPHSDRFALGILIAEVLLMGPYSPTPQEDGTYFSQEQLASPTDDFVQNAVRKLGDVSRRIGGMFQLSLFAKNFEECPSPHNWLATIRAAQRELRDKSSSLGSATARRKVKRQCPRCNNAFWADSARIEQLETQGKDALCGACLKVHLEERKTQRLKCDWEYPEVVCEHCMVNFRTERSKVESLRSRGRALLCRSCLENQMERWAQEQVQRDMEFPKVSCGNCSAVFRIRQEKLAELHSKGRTPLCNSCLEVEMQRWSEDQANRDQNFPRVTCGMCRSSFRIPRSKLDRLRGDGVTVLCRSCRGFV